MAARPRLGVQPYQEVHKVKGEFTRTVAVPVTTTKKIGPEGHQKEVATTRIEFVEEKFTEGYMVYFPAKAPGVKGHSILVAADDHVQIAHLGLLRPVARIDMDIGEEVPDDYRPSTLREAAEAHERVTALSTGGLSDLEDNL